MGNKKSALDILYLHEVKKKGYTGPFAEGYLKGLKDGGKVALVKAMIKLYAIGNSIEEIRQFLQPTGDVLTILDQLEYLKYGIPVKIDFDDEDNIVLKRI